MVGMDMIVTHRTYVLPGTITSISCVNLVEGPVFSSTQQMNIPAIKIMVLVYMDV